MAHEIHKNDSLVLNRTDAWHGLGKVIQQDMSPNDALRISNMDWKVEKTPLSTIINGESTPLKDFIGITRMDTKETFSIFKAYEIVQNSELFEMAYAVSNEVLVESAGSLFNGRKVFICLRGDSFCVNGSDEINKYLLLANSHDGTLALTAQPTSVRVVPITLVVSRFKDP